MQGKHWVTLAMILGSVSLMVSGLDHWGDALKPQFVAGVMATIATVLKAMFEDKPSAGGNAVSPSTLAKVGLLVLALGGGSLFFAGCAKGQPNLTPEQKAAQVASVVLPRLEELQNAVIATNELTPGAIPDSIAVPVVKFCVEAAKLLRDAPNGVVPAIAARWNALKGDIPVSVRQRPEVAAAFVAVDIALAEFGR